MNADVKEKWLNALRSGAYKQTTNVLRDTHLDGTSEYCCLGVLCDLHAKDTGGQWDGNCYIDKDGLPPVEVVEWAGLMSTEYDNYCDAEGVEILAGADSLSMLNDGGCTFQEIAEIIDKRL